MLTHQSGFLGPAPGDQGTDQVPGCLSPPYDGPASLGLVQNIFLTLHVLTAIFAVGPLVHTTTTAVRGLRTGDAGATATSARTATIYSYASILVVFIGFGMMSIKDENGTELGKFTEPWIWISALLWLIAVGLTLGLIVPTLRQATTRIGAGETVDALKAKVAAPGGVVALLFAAIIVLMVYKPGH